MTIPLTGSQGLYTRWGHEIYLVNIFETYFGTTVPNAVANVQAQYTTTDQQVINGNSGLYSQLTNYQGTSQSWLTYVNGSPTSGLMQQTLNSMVADDNSTANVSSLSQGLSYVIFQMKANNQAIQQHAVGQSVTAGTYTTGGSNVGNGSMTCSVVNPLNGLQFDYAFAEILATLCTNDSYGGHGASPGAEPFAITGPASVNQYAYNWPQGSGTNNFAANAFSPENASALVTDGDFEVWTGGTTLTNWFEVGNSQISRSASSYTGNFAVQITGDSSTNAEIYQAVTLSPTTSYGFNLQAKYSSSAPGSGVITIRLLDSAGNQIQDQAGNNALVSFNLSSLTTSYTPLPGYLRTPLKLNTNTQRISIKMTTPVPTSTNLLIDCFGFNPGTQLYASGPIVNIWAGSTPYAIGDSFALTVTNAAGLSTFQRSLDRMFGLRTLQLQIPSQLSTFTISDALIA